MTKLCHILVQLAAQFVHVCDAGQGLEAIRHLAETALVPLSVALDAGDSPGHGNHHFSYRRVAIFQGKLIRPADLVQVRQSGGSSLVDFLARGRIVKPFRGFLKRDFALFGEYRVRRQRGLEMAFPQSAEYM